MPNLSADGVLLLIERLLLGTRDVPVVEFGAVRYALACLSHRGSPTGLR